MICKILRYLKEAMTPECLAPGACRDVQTVRESNRGDVASSRARNAWLSGTWSGGRVSANKGRLKLMLAERSRAVKRGKYEKSEYEDGGHDRVWREGKTVSPPLYAMRAQMSSLWSQSSLKLTISSFLINRAYHLKRAHRAGSMYSLSDRILG